MAEYIDRKQIKYRKERVLNSWAGNKHTDCDVRYKNIVEQCNINNIPTADVIERSKIDKAIEEIENEIKFWDCPVNYQEPLEVQRNKQAKANSYRHALEILKRNIGE